MTDRGESFTISDNAVDPKAVPKATLRTGAAVPAIGFGTFGSDHVSHENMAKAVLGAASVGYRHFDCAMVYGNEREIGRAFRKLFNAGIPREELWVTSKLWNDMHGEPDIIPACRRSIADLEVDYLDLYLIHWPFPNYHPPGCDATSRSADAKPYIHDNYMKTWRQLERLVAMGIVRHIGVSNMTIPKMELLLRDAKIKPAAIEMELHPHFQQPDLFDYVVENGLLPIGYCPLGSPNRPERDRTPDDTNDLADPVIVSIAKRMGVHPAEICMKWAVQRGQVPIPMSTNPRNYLSNLEAVTEKPLTDDDMRAIAKVDKQCRLINGQVFLWKEGLDWRDLWDEDGVITPS